MTVYFNSLKDLGKASTLVDDDVKDFIIRTANRMFTTRRLIVRADELTSRVSTTELNETLDKLEKIEYSKENTEAKRYPSNILLATNMISVGIDVAAYAPLAEQSLYAIVQIQTEHSLFVRFFSRHRCEFCN